MGAGVPVFIVIHLLAKEYWKQCSGQNTNLFHAVWNTEKFERSIPNLIWESFASCNWISELRNLGRTQNMLSIFRKTRSAYCVKCICQINKGGLQHCCVSNFITSKNRHKNLSSDIYHPVTLFLTNSNLPLSSHH